MNKDIPELKEYNIPEIRGYDIVEYINRGRWTPVFKAINKKDGSEWALKFYRPDELAQQYVEAGGWTEEDLWKKECQDGKTPLHENIAFNTLGEADNKETILIEVYCGKVFLDQYLEQVGIPKLEETIHIARGMTAALEVQHTRAGGKGRAHGDFAPKNMAYFLEEGNEDNLEERVGDRRVMLSDFGTSTIGNREVGKRGYEEIRALEQFSDTVCPSKTGDVFSFGSTLYKMFTGKYAFEDELKRFGKSTEKHFEYLVENPAIWNATIDEKVKDERIPKQFRKLLKRCLYSPEEIKREGFWAKTYDHTLGRVWKSQNGRIKDGVELKKELEKTIKRYEASKNRWKRYSIAAAALLALGIGAGFGANAVNEEIKLRDKKIEYGKKVRVAKMYKDNAKSIYNDSEEAMEYGELVGWYFTLKEDGIEDPMIQYSAYINPKLTYKAIREVGPEFNNDFLHFIFERDPHLYGALWTIKGGGTDNFTRLVSRERSEKVKERWAKVKEDYQKKKEEEEKIKKWGESGVGPGGPNLGWQPKDGWDKALNPNKKGSEK